MRVLVTGNRRWSCPDLAEQVVGRLLLKYDPDLIVVHGGAIGVDESFAEACAVLGVDHEPHPARWDDLDVPGAVIREDKQGRQYNANAGPTRNQEMVDAGAGLCVAVHRGFAWSHGTKDCARWAIAAGIPTYLIDSEEAHPVRIWPTDPQLR